MNYAFSSSCGDQKQLPHLTPQLPGQGFSIPWAKAWLNVCMHICWLLFFAFFLYSTSVCPRGWPNWEETWVLDFIGFSNTLEGRQVSESRYLWSRFRPLSQPLCHRMVTMKGLHSQARMFQIFTLCFSFHYNFHL